MSKGSGGTAGAWSEGVGSCVRSRRVNRGVRERLFSRKGGAGKCRSTKNLSQHGIKRAQLRNIARRRVVVIVFLGVAIALLVQRPMLRGVPDRVREADVLGEQQQRADELNGGSYDAVGRSRQKVGHAEFIVVPPTHCRATRLHCPCQSTCCVRAQSRTTAILRTFSAPSHPASPLRYSIG